MFFAYCNTVNEKKNNDNSMWQYEWILYYWLCLNSFVAIFFSWIYWNNLFYNVHSLHQIQYSVSLPFVPSSLRCILSTRNACSICLFWRERIASKVKKQFIVICNWRLCPWNDYSCGKEMRFHENVYWYSCIIIFLYVTLLLE